MVLIEGYVMYQVVISYQAYSNWSIYREWFQSDIHEPFDDYCKGNYPEVISIEMVNGMFLGREYTFESESYYHWFLLKVM